MRYKQVVLANLLAFACGIHKKVVTAASFIYSNVCLVLESFFFSSGNVWIERLLLLL